MLERMADQSDNIPVYRTIRMTAAVPTEATQAEVEAWRAREEYPEILGGHRAVFGPACELDSGGWELQQYFGAGAPQEVRDSLAAGFRRKAAAALEAGDRAAYDEYTAAARRMDREPLNEMTVCGVRYRVVRAEQFIRLGPTGPEPPRLSDPDPAPAGDGRLLPDPVAGFVVDPYTATGMSEGILKAELLQLVRGGGSGPDQRARTDSHRALHSHPGGVLLPPAFVMAERIQGQWSPSVAASANPQAARDVLALDLRVMAPVMMRLGPEDRELYARAADRLDDRRGNELQLPGRDFRLMRIERMVRVGPDGPEGPRPSDYDPLRPVPARRRSASAHGIDGEEFEDEAPEDEQFKEDEEEDGSLSEPTARELELLELFAKEEARRTARAEMRARERRGEQGGNRGA